MKAGPAVAISFVVTGLVCALAAPCYAEFASTVPVLVLRRTRPDLPRAFKVPGVPILAAPASFYLMLNLPAATWVRFVIWMAIGIVVYFAYGARHSRLQTDPNHIREAGKASRPT